MKIESVSPVEGGLWMLTVHTKELNLDELKSRLEDVMPPAVKHAPPAHIIGLNEDERPATVLSFAVPVWTAGGVERSFMGRLPDGRLAALYSRMTINRCAVLVTESEPGAAARLLA